VLNNRKPKESLKNSIILSLKLEMEEFGFEVNKTNKNCINASPIHIVKAKFIANAYSTIKINLTHLLDLRISSLSISILFII
jgi:hypothetical protein